MIVKTFIGPKTLDKLMNLSADEIQELAAKTGFQLPKSIKPKFCQINYNKNNDREDGNWIFLQVNYHLYDTERPEDDQFRDWYNITFVPGDKDGTYTLISISKELFENNPPELLNKDGFTIWSRVFEKIKTIDQELLYLYARNCGWMHEREYGDKTRVYRFKGISFLEDKGWVIAYFADTRYDPEKKKWKESKTNQMFFFSGDCHLCSYQYPAF